MIYGYLRKSNEERSESSFDTQKHKINGYCSIHNIVVDEWFEDICSGGLLLKQRQQGMLLSTKIAKGDSIICSALDRYSRSHYGLVNDVHLYKKKGINLIFSDLGNVVASDSLGSVFYNILSVMSEWYRKSLSEKQLVAKEKLRSQGKYLGGRVQFGKDIGDGNHLIVSEKQQRELNLILSLRAKGYTYKQIKGSLEVYTGRKWFESFICKLVKRDELEQIKVKSSINSAVQVEMTS